MKISWLAVAFIVAMGVQLFAGCGTPADSGRDKDTIDWCMSWYFKKAEKPDDSILNLRAAQLTADEAAMERFLGFLGKAKVHNPRNEVAVWFAKFLFDRKSADILGLLAVEGDDEIRLIAITSLLYRYRLPQIYGLDSSAVLKVLERSRSDWARGMVLSLAEKDADFDKLLSTGLADSGIGVRESALGILDAGRTERRMAKEWLRRRAGAVELSEEIPGDMEICVSYMAKAYGLAGFRWEDLHLVDYMLHVQRILWLADEIDKFTDELEAQKRGDSVVPKGDRK